MHKHSNEAVHTYYNLAHFCRRSCRSGKRCTTFYDGTASAPQFFRIVTPFHGGVPREIGFSRASNIDFGGHAFCTHTSYVRVNGCLACNSQKCRSATASTLQYCVEIYVIIIYVKWAWLTVCRIYHYLESCAAPAPVGTPVTARATPPL